MWEFTRIGVTSGARFAQPMAAGEIVVEAGALPGLRLFDPVLDETAERGMTGCSAGRGMTVCQEISARTR